MVLPWDSSRICWSLPLGFSVVSSCVLSTRPMPATSLRHWAANVRISSPPKDSPTSTHGPLLPVFINAVCNSYAICFIVRGRGPKSLHALPARSYEHTRVKRDIPGCTKLQSNEKSPAPDSSTTVGLLPLLLPELLRCNRHPPTSTNLPGGGGGFITVLPV